MLRQLNVQRPGRGYSQRIGTEKQEIALLRILIASAERAIEAFQASANINDVDLLADLERVVERSRNELAALTERGGTADPA